MDQFLSVQVTGQPELEAKIKAINQALDTRAILDEGGAVLFNRVRTRFLDEIDPTGVKWPRSRAAIRRERLGRGGGTLFATGRMFRGLQLYADSPTSRAIGVNVTSKTGFPYPMVHQFGLGFPQRQFLGFGDEDVNMMSRVIIHRLVRALTAVADVKMPALPKIGGLT